MGKFINIQLLRSTVSKSAIVVFHLIKDGRNSFAELLDVGICSKAHLCRVLNELKKEGWINQTQKGQYEVCEKSETYEEVSAGVSNCGYTTPLTNTVLVGISPITGLELSVKPDQSQSENRTQNQTGQNVQCSNSGFETQSRPKTELLTFKTEPTEEVTPVDRTKEVQNRTNDAKPNHGGDKYTFKIKDNKEIERIENFQEEESEVPEASGTFGALFARVDFEHNEEHRHYRAVTAKFLAEKDISDDLVDRVALGGILGVCAFHAETIKKIWAEAAEKKREGRIKYKWVDLANYTKLAFEAIGVKWEPCRSYRECLVRRKANAMIPQNKVVSQNEVVSQNKVVSQQEVVSQNKVVSQQAVTPQNKVRPKTASSQAYADMTPEEKQTWHAENKEMAGKWKKQFLQQLREVQAGKRQVAIPTEEVCYNARHGLGEFADPADSGMEPGADYGIDYDDPETVQRFAYFQRVEDEYKHAPPDVIPFPQTTKTRSAAHRGRTAQSSVPAASPPLPPKKTVAEPKPEPNGFEKLAQKIKKFEAAYQKKEAREALQWK